MITLKLPMALGIRLTWKASLFKVRWQLVSIFKVLSNCSFATSTVYDSLSFHHLLLKMNLNNNHSWFLESISSTYHECSSFVTLILEFHSFFLEVPWLVAFDEISVSTYSDGWSRIIWAFLQNLEVWTLKLQMLQTIQFPTWWKLHLV